MGLHQKKRKRSKNSLYALALVRLRRNKRAMVGLFVILLVILVACLAPYIAPYGYDEQDTSAALLAPSWQHLCGTDQYGRDIFSRLIYGTPSSLQIGLISVGISAVLGVTIGAVAGFFGGKTDMIIMRFLDVFYSIPAMLMAIAIAAALGNGMGNAMIAVGISQIPGYARLIRGQILTIRDAEFVEAARLADAGNLRIIFKHIVPNCLSPIIVNMTMGFASAILMAAGLSFLGLGAQPPSPEWGAMITAGRNYIRKAWWMATCPGLVIMITVISFNLLGDGIRDALDPRMKR